MNIKPWKLTFLAAFSLAGSAAFAQNVQSAQKAIQLERYSEAKRTLLPQSSNPDAAFELGRLYQMQEKPDSAAYFFNLASKDPKSPKSMVAAGRAFLAQGKKAEAEIQFENAAKATKRKDAQILAAIGQAYAETKTKDNQKGIDYINEALKVNKKDDAAMLVALGDIYENRDNGGGDAMNAYDRALRADPNYVPAYYKKGQLSVRARNGKDALENFQKVTSLDPNFAPVYRDMAEMYYYGNQYDQAAQTMKKYTDMSEKSPNTQATYAAFLYLNKKYPEALTQIQEVLAKDPNNLTMNRLLAYTYFDMNQNDLAVTAMDKYMKMAPADKIITEDYVYQGKILTKAGRSDEGIAIIEKAIKADPSKASDLQNDLASAYVLKKDYAKAIKIYRDKLAKEPALADQVRLANLYSVNKQYTQADSLLNIVVTARPTYAPGHLLRAQANANLDADMKQGLAKPYYEKYIELSKAEGSDPAKFRGGLIEANNYLGFYNLQKGDKAAAQTYFQQVLALDPTNADATRAMSSTTAKAKAPAKAPVKKK
ncbi:tetratricopeptide repeat protein [Hymenobacter busanensis]|uniref:Tetratricopeptide repeat protein n=1 Tax=Hymenobacter busanensis TaxID=2607656 RepID=A0A7L4ZYW9_9BACT|nr:tetratricopeptide repeat protein [Hymenobacter busanensis]KAA9331545.1 tetratricopeptide repeat protein [Hymenobacter busanensis]QHJ08699.1 tetratricopeptide repeat protein [Hymenobacter busanensis]